MNSVGARCRGFTLLEVLVAFLVLSLSLGVIMQILSLSARNTHAAENRQHALILAESKMAELLAEPELFTGSRRGEFNGKYRWEADSGVWEFPDTDSGISYQLIPYRVTLDVLWSEAPGHRIRLSSVQLVSDDGL